MDRYGRKIPKHAHGTANLREYTASARMITDAVMELYDRIVNPHLMVRRISMARITYWMKRKRQIRQNSGNWICLLILPEAMKRSKAG